MVYVGQDGYVNLLVCCCCDGFYAWYRYVFANITATGVNGISETFVLHIDCGTQWAGSNAANQSQYNSDEANTNGQLMSDESDISELDQFAEPYMSGIDDSMPDISEIDDPIPDIPEIDDPLPDTSGIDDPMSDYYTLYVPETYEVTTDEVVEMNISQPTGQVVTIREFTFDNRGNRASMTVTGSENYTVTYTYDLNNRMLSSTRTGAGAETSLYTYDRNGNQLTRTAGGLTETRTYDAFNQLTRVSKPGMIVTYEYRASGLRRAKTVNNRRTEHVQFKERRKAKMQ